VRGVIFDKNKLLKGLTIVCGRVNLTIAFRVGYFDRMLPLPKATSTSEDVGTVEAGEFWGEDGGGS